MAQTKLTDIEQAAFQVLELARALVLAENHYFAGALGRLRAVPGSYEKSLATNGRILGVDAMQVCSAFMDDEMPPTHDLLHAVLHCVFLHPFTGAATVRQYWNLACDLAVERLVAEALGARPGPRGHAIAEALESVEQTVGQAAGAEKIYLALRDGAWDSKRHEWEDLFCADDHVLWYQENRGSDRDKGAFDSDDGAGEQAKQEWERVAKSLAVNLQTFERGNGDTQNNLIDELEDVTQIRHDYAQFLRQFAVPGEVIKVSENEFDYVYYTYGLSLYGDMPLIEPLEYREQNRVKEFVIVIDTSGSVWGDAVRQFASATFDILKSTEAFFDRVHVRIIQCDTRVRSDAVITNTQEMAEWAHNVRAHGGGGTDFRAAFSYVDNLIKDGEFENLGGLIYFTDGWGTYPDCAPEYRCAFVFYDENHRPDCVPSWAAQIVVRQADLEALEGQVQ